MRSVTRAFLADDLPSTNVSQPITPLAQNKGFRHGYVRL